MKELDAGFLRGPFESEAGVSEFLGRNDCSLSQIFLLLQGAELKPRVIDNLEGVGSQRSFRFYYVDFVGRRLRSFISSCHRAQPLRFA